MSICPLKNIIVNYIFTISCCCFNRRIKYCYDKFFNNSFCKTCTCKILICMFARIKSFRNYKWIKCNIEQCCLIFWKNTKKCINNIADRINEFFNKLLNSAFFNKESEVRNHIQYSSYRTDCLACVLWTNKNIIESWEERIENIENNIIFISTLLWVSSFLILLRSNKTISFWWAAENLKERIDSIFVSVCTC